ncbi:hypothetical protein KP79_PYT07722 [Mizuhopecten yessoensis]|uniref:Uncharacterized protein n=2 Tax=Mizuhopecten yessoensis TaxID=6573 RepID=A0A210QFG9_MIZYE|nr:hypothetical protein KP79_PYT07722 [Mizuhopecten yessoensis]
MDPLYKAYKNMTASSTRDTLIKSVTQWAADNLSLTSLRPGMLGSLTTMCKKTSIMTKPEDLRKEALSSIQGFLPLSAPTSPTSPQIPVSISSPSVSPDLTVMPQSPVMPTQEFRTDDRMDMCTVLDGQIDTLANVMDTIMAENEIPTSSQLLIDNMLSDSLLDSLAKQVDIPESNLPELGHILPVTTLDSLTPSNTFEGILSTQSMNSTVIPGHYFTQSLNFVDMFEPLCSNSFSVMNSCNLVTSPSAVSQTNHISGNQQV